EEPTLTDRGRQHPRYRLLSQNLERLHMQRWAAHVDAEASALDATGDPHTLPGLGGAAAQSIDLAVVGDELEEAAFEIVVANGTGELAGFGHRWAVYRARCAALPCGGASAADRADRAARARSRLSRS